MKTVILDWATMGPGLDLSEMRALLPDLTVYDETSPAEIAARIAGAGIVLGNKIIMTEAEFTAMRAAISAGLVSS